MLRKLAFLTLVLMAGPAAAQYDSPLFSTLLSPTGLTETADSFLLVDLDGDGREDAVLGLSFELGLAWADATGGFAPVETLAFTHDFASLDAGDLDQDGDQDLVFSNPVSSFSQAVTGLLLNDGSGSFVEHGVGTQEEGLDVTLGDLDGDGDPDLLFADEDSDEVRIALGGSGASFGAVSGTNAGDEPVALHLGDVNGDGQLDVAVARRVGAALLLGDGAGALGPPRPVDTGGHGVDVALLDMDVDGMLDLVIASSPFGPLGDGWLATARGQGNGLFDDPLTLDLGYEPVHLALMDADGDGLQDLVASSAIDWVGVLRVDGLGGFDPMQAFSNPWAGPPVEASDRDGDGAPDLVIPGEEAFLELRNDGAGAFFGPRAHALGGTEPEVSVAGDLDGDGDLDVAVPMRFSGAISVLLGDGAGGLGPPTLWPSLSGPLALALGDLDQDGDLDVLAPEHGLYALGANDGAGGFPSWTTYALSAVQSTRSVTTADLNGDGLIDAGRVSDDYLILSWGDGAGSFSSTTEIELGLFLYAQSLAFADLDGDGDLDAVAGGTGKGGPNESGLAILEGDGLGGFTLQPPLTYTGGHAFDLEAADVDADGDQDLVSLSYGTDELIVHLADGVGGFDAPQAVATVKEPFLMDAADLDGDGVVDLVVSSASQYVHEIAVHFGQSGVGPEAVQMQWSGRDPLSSTAADLAGDGFPELLVTTQTADALVVLTNTGPSAWRTQPGGIAGTKGVPLLDGEGTLAGGSPLRLTVSRALPNTLTTLVLGVATLGAPFKGGLLVPDPLLLLPLPTDPWGYVVVEDTWPPGIPAGVSMVLQEWLPDGQAAKGFAASDGVIGTTP